MDYCNIYINERSAVVQYADEEAVEEAIVKLIDCLSLFDSCDSSRVKIQRYYCGSVYTDCLAYRMSLQNLSNKELKRKFQFVLKDACNWTDAPLTDIAAKYTHNGADVSWTSMSEAYERRFPLLVNFICSPITEPVASVNKKDVGSVDIESYSDSASVLTKLVRQGWRRREYDMLSSYPPLDEESILADDTVFEPTGYRYKGRVMYRRKGTNQLCYIDSKHPGAAAHIEVFDEATKEAVCKLKINEDKEFRPLTRNEKRRKLRIDNA